MHVPRVLVTDFVLDIKGESDGPIGRGEGNEEASEDYNKELPPEIGKQSDVIEDSDRAGNEEDAHVVDEELTDFMEVIRFDPTNEKEDKQKHHPDQRSREGEVDEAKQIGKHGSN